MKFKFLLPTVSVIVGGCVSFVCAQEHLEIVPYSGRQGQDIPVVQTTSKASPHYPARPTATQNPQDIAKKQYIEGMTTETDMPWWEWVYRKGIENKLSLGIRYNTVSMKDTVREEDETRTLTYLGYLYKLEETETDKIGFVIRYAPIPYLAFEAANDIEFTLRTVNIGETSDGSIHAKGWTYSLYLMYPFEIDEYFILKPYVGIGIVDLSANYEYANWWHYGWSSPENYAEYGNGSTEPRNKISRYFVFNGPKTGMVYTAGLSVQLLRYMELDVFVRKVDIDDLETDFYKSFGSTKVFQRSGAFPLEHTSVGASLRVVF